ncbi:hypothetical protein [Brachybacterium phenoliresistens]|uniref:Uncharacterized protein n=1 Tax=Brachybacterium phenoliresistens TaxID=396014 RepID=Z9JYM0_9MICO|nr:hypothetical protein [Brachybacterium phenoliresistens]EWS82911.1 hypothetical protein BF93_07795 [Brachybacterium phenoliresistens]
MSTQRPGPGTDPERPEDGVVHVSPLTVPALFLGLVVGFLAAYFFLGWGAFVLVAVVVGALSALVRGSRHREAAIALVLGTAVGYCGVILLALFRGAL